MPRTEIPSAASLFVDPPAAGAWNMALDEALLESAAASGGCFLRFYQWSEPTLSLGYFQRHADRGLHAASADCPIVRRPSGGGAILHDRELTYSLCLPLDAEFRVSPQTLTLEVHQALREALAAFDIPAAICDDPPVRAARQDEPFLCFARRAAGDLLLDGAKICGSAQRRRRGAVLQHGSLLLGRSLSAPELPGIADLRSCEIEPAALIDIWTRRLEDRLRVYFEASTLGVRVRQRTQRLAAERYASPVWLRRR